MAIYNAENRLLLIQDAIIGASSQYNYENGEVFIFPILDALRLLFQEPLIFSFFKNKSDFIYTTLHDDEFIELHRGSIEIKKINDLSFIQIGKKNDYYMVVQIIKFDKNKGAIFKFPQLIAATFKKLFLELEKNIEGKKVIEIICKVLSSHVPQHLKEPPTKHLPSFEIPPVQEHLNLIRQVFEEAFAGVEQTPLLRTIPGKHSELLIPNLFSVVRTATIKQLRRKSFNYTARLLLTHSQRNKILSQKETWRINDQMLEQLEYPLGINSRSIADSVFRSGIVDFSDEKPGYGRDIAHDNDDIKRQKAEKNIYDNIISDSRAFYIPIHVNGVPWIALLSLTPKNTDVKSFWQHNFQIYRSQISGIADKIRDGAQEIYAAKIGDILAGHFRNIKNYNRFQSFNEDCIRLAAIFPFDSIRIVDHPEAANHFTIRFSNKTLSFVHDDNILFGRQIGYRAGETNNLKNKLQSLVYEMESINSQIDFQEHTVFNLIAKIPTNEMLENLNENKLDETKKNLLDVKSGMELLETALHFMVGHQGFSKEFRTLKQIIRWLEKRVLSSENSPSIEMIAASDILITDEDMPYAFAVIWNLWHNASKTYSDEQSFEIVIRDKESKELEITFRNAGEINNEWIEFLLNEGPIPDQRRRGLQIIKNSLKKLNWIFRNISVADGCTSITISIYNDNGGKNEGIDS